MPTADPLTILIPLYNDWDPLGKLLAQIETAISQRGSKVNVLVVDDASTEPMPPNWPGERFRAIERIEILHLRANLGHQRAIALGLYHIHEFTTAPAVAVMDADGEDRPEDLPKLIQEFSAGGGREVTFAARTKRMESRAFRIFYELYRVVHRALTGIEVRVGNFSVAPRSAVTRLMAVPDLWNHYAAAVFRAKLPKRLLPLPRGTRISGQSKMNFVSLLNHGLAAMSVFSDQVSARLLAASAAFATAGLVLIAAVAGIRLFSTVDLPTWAAYTVGVLLGLVAQALTFAVLFAFLIAQRRNSVGFLPLRDAQYFIVGKTVVAAPGGLRALTDKLQGALR